MAEHNPKTLQRQNSSGIPQPEELRLKLQPKPPRYPFVHTDFEITIFLVDAEDQLKCGEHFELDVSLRLAPETGKSRDMFQRQDILEVDGKCAIERGGSCHLKMRITELSMSFQNQPFCLRIACKDSGGNYKISSLYSDPMTVVQYCLALPPDHKLPSVWYKDEGGAEKTMEFEAVLLGPGGAAPAAALGRAVPLRLALLYASGRPVPNQDLLRPAAPAADGGGSGNPGGGGPGGGGGGGAKLELVDGRVRFRFRIEEVSKNHNKQLFRVQVEPDTAAQPGNFDIGALVAPPVEVRSKRSKKQKREAALGGGGGGGGLGGGLSPGAGLLAGEDGLLTPAGRRRKLGGGGRDDGGVGAAAGGAGAHPQLAAAVAGTSEALLALGAAQRKHLASAALAAGEGLGLYDALRNVLQWTGAVVQSLQELKWQPIGYEARPDGLPDRARPLHSMRNPNAAVDRLLDAYANETMHHLHALARKVEEYYETIATGGTAGAAAAAAAGGGVPTKMEPPSLTSQAGGAGGGNPPLAPPLPPGLQQHHQGQGNGGLDRQGSLAFLERMDSFLAGQGAGASGAFPAAAVVAAAAATAPAPPGAGGIGGGGAEGFRLPLQGHAAAAAAAAQRSTTMQVFQQLGLDRAESFANFLDAGGLLGSQAALSRQGSLALGGAAPGGGGLGLGLGLGVGQGGGLTLGGGGGGGAGGAAAAAADAQAQAAEQAAQALLQQRQQQMQQQVQQQVSQSQMQMTQPMQQMAMSMAPNLESQVFYILAKTLPGGPGGSGGGGPGGGGAGGEFRRGFPAFDQRKQLLGFYQEAQDPTLGTQVVFVPRDGAAGNEPLSKNEQLLAVAELESELQKNKGSVLSMTTSQNDLERLKEDAMVYHWTHSMVAM